MDTDMLAHFDNWQREGHDDDYEAQDQWPVELRRARLIPAVDYIQVIYLRKLSCTFICLDFSIGAELQCLCSELLMSRRSEHGAS